MSKAKFFPCENCDGKSTVDGITECSWCVGWGQIPDAAENEREASRDVAHALGQLVIWACPENEERLAEALLVFVRAIKGERDPWAQR